MRRRRGERARALLRCRRDGLRRSRRDGLRERSRLVEPAAMRKPTPRATLAKARVVWKKKPRRARTRGKENIVMAVPSVREAPRTDGETEKAEGEREREH